MYRHDLLEYLEKYHTESSSEQIALDFIDKFGVKLITHPNYPRLFQFKYNQLLAKWSFPLTYFCRGIVMERNEKKWKVAGFPFMKFFNLGEPKCTLYPEVYAAEPGRYARLSKEDGTCIHMYHNEGEWHVSTLGTVVTGNVNGADGSFETLWWGVVEKNYHKTPEQFKANLVPGYSYMFELCTPYNRIVSKYNTDKIFLLGVRVLKDSYHLLTQGEVDDIAMKLEVDRPTFTMCNDLLTTAALIEFAEAESLIARPGEPEYKEGFVIYDGSVPVAKIKNKKYLALFATIGGHNIFYVAKTLVELYFTGGIDDVYPALSDELKNGCEYLKSVVHKIVVTAEYSTVGIHSWHNTVRIQDKKEARKQYAMKTQEYADTLGEDAPIFEKSLLRTFLLNNYEKIVAGEPTDIIEQIMLKLTVNNDYWKKLILSKLDPKMVAAHAAKKETEVVE